MVNEIEMQPETAGVEAEQQQQQQQQGAGAVPSPVPESSDPLINLRIGAKYDMQKKIGEGSFGIIYIG